MAKPGDEVKFCWTCGHSVIKIECHSHFDTASGNEVVFNYYKCPNERWWKLGHWVEPKYWLY